MASRASHRSLRKPVRSCSPVRCIVTSSHPTPELHSDIELPTSEARTAHLPPRLFDLFSVATPSCYLPRDSLYERGVAWSQAWSETLFTGAAWS